MIQSLEDLVSGKKLAHNRIKVPPVGPSSAEVMIIGEAPGGSEEAALTPFVGQAGLELTRMLHEVGFVRNDCWITNVCKYRPPKNNIELFFKKFPREPNELITEGVAELNEEISRVQPKLIITLGNVPTWALTGNIGITKWRGSLLSYKGIPLIPTYHPAAILRKWDWRFVAIHDFKKAKRVLEGKVKPTEEHYIVRPDFSTVMSTIEQLLWMYEQGSEQPLAVDIETRRGHIACLGFAWSESEALCIPFMDINRLDGYWSADEELEIILALRKLLTHPGCKVVGQNFPYDTQYIVKHWHFVPNLWWDTMTVHHSLFSTMPKGLDFQSSLYLDDHIYWKDEGKEWNAKMLPEETLWVYNCKDCTKTLRIQAEQARVHSQMNWPTVNNETALSRQMSLHGPITEAMLRGVRISSEKKVELAKMCDEQIKVREQFLTDVIGYPINPRSPKQLQGFFYEECNIKPIRNYKTGKPTCNEAALITIGERHAILRPVTNAINDIRSLSTYRAVAQAPISDDSRVRCQYTIPGTVTYRFASSTDAFGDGLNLQNVSSGNEAKLAYIYPEGIPPTAALMPNMRKMMVPDPGYEIGDFDLAQADAQVVAAEAQDTLLLELFEDPERDLHNENCDAIFGRGAHKDKSKRAMGKAGVHLTNYGGTPYIMSRTLGITVKEAERFQDVWFSAHPGIKEWQDRVLVQLQTKRFVENRFGYRIYYFDRIENLLKEALAWIPQSTVAIVTNMGIRNVWRNGKQLGIQFLMQVHDSAVFQYPIENAETCRAFIREQMKVPIPYERPLIIPVGGDFSVSSWGECK